MVLISPASNPCVDHPCKNGGSCSQVGDTFKCDCITGWTGATCETGEAFCQQPNGGFLSNALFSVVLETVING